MVNGKVSEDAQSSRSKLWTSIHEFAEKLQYVFSPYPPSVSESGGSWVSRDVSISVVKIKIKSDSSLSNLESSDSALGGCQFVNFGPASCRAPEPSMSGSLVVDVSAAEIDSQGAPSSVENDASFVQTEYIPSNQNEMIKSTDKLDSAMDDERTEPTLSINTLCTGKSSLQYVEPERAEPQEVVGPCGRRYKIIEEIEEVHNSPSVTRHVVRVVIAPCKTFETVDDMDLEFETPKPIRKRSRLRNRIDKFWKSDNRIKSNMKPGFSDDPTQSTKPTFSSSTTDSEKSEETNSILQIVASSGEKSDFRDRRCCNYANLLDAADSYQEKNESWVAGVGRGLQNFGQEPILTEESNDIISLSQSTDTFSDRSSTSMLEDETSSHDDEKLKANTAVADVSLATATETWSRSMTSTNTDSYETFERGSNVNEVALDGRQRIENVSERPVNKPLLQPKSKEEFVGVDLNMHPDIIKKSEARSTSPQRQFSGQDDSKGNLKEGLGQEYQLERTSGKLNPPITPLRGILKRRKFMGLDQIVNEESNGHDATLNLILQASPGDNKVGRDDTSSEGITPKVRNLSVDKHQKDWIKPRSKGATDLQTDRDMMEVEEATENGVEVGLTLHDSTCPDISLRESNHGKFDDALGTTETQTLKMDGDPSLVLDHHATSSEHSATISACESGGATPQNSTQKRSKEIVTAEARPKNENHCENAIASILMKSGMEQNSLAEPSNASEGHFDTAHINGSGLSTTKRLAAPYEIETDSKLEAQTKGLDGLGYDSNDRLLEGHSEPPKSMSSINCTGREDNDANNAGAASPSLDVPQHDTSRFPVEVATNFTRDALDTKLHTVEDSESIEPLLELDGSRCKSGEDLLDNTRDLNKIEMLLSDAFGSGLEFTESQNEEVVQLLKSEVAMEKNGDDKNVAGFNLLTAVQMLVNRMKREKDTSKEGKATNENTDPRTETGQMLLQYEAASEAEVKTPFENTSRTLGLDGDLLRECRDDPVVDERSDQAETVTRLDPDLQLCNNLPLIVQTHESLTPAQLPLQADKTDVFQPSQSARDTIETSSRKEEVRSLHLAECEGSQVGFVTADKWVDFKNNTLHISVAGSDESSCGELKRKWNASPGMDAYVPDQDFEGYGIEVFETPGDLYGLRIDDDWGTDGTYVSTLALMQPHVTKKVLISKRSLGRRKRGGLLSADNNYPATQRPDYENLSNSCSINKDDDVVTKPSFLSSLGRLWIIGSLMKNRRAKSKDAAIAESSSDFFSAGNERLVSADKDAGASSDFLEMVEKEQNNEKPSKPDSLTMPVGEGSQEISERRSPPPYDSVVSDRRSAQPLSVQQQHPRGNWSSLGRRRKSQSMTDLRGSVAPISNRSPRHNLGESRPVIAPDGVEVTFIA